MPPKYKKSNPRARGKNGGGGIEGIMERNKMERDEDGVLQGGDGGYPGGGKGKGRGKGKAAESGDEESSEEEEKTKVAVKKPSAPTEESGNTNRGPAKLVEKEGIGELSRKQREELEKEKSRRKYEELHKAGKTDEAKVDLARLAEVKKRREDAAQKKVETEAAAKELEDLKSKKGQGHAEMKLALGGEAAKLRGERSQINKKAAEERKEGKKAAPDLFTIYKSADDVVPDAPKLGEKGTVDNARAVEEDFM